MKTVSSVLRVVPDLGIMMVGIRRVHQHGRPQPQYAQERLDSGGNDVAIIENSRCGTGLTPERDICTGASDDGKL
jgi:hypothetical protein